MASFVALVLSLFMGPQVFVSNHGLLVPNEHWAVGRLTTLPPQANTDLGPFTRSSAAGFHVVCWSKWHAGGRYVIIPKWAVVSLAGAVFTVVSRIRN